MNLKKLNVQEISVIEMKTVEGGDYGGRYGTGNGLVYALEAASELLSLIGSGISELAKSGAHQSHGM